MPSSTMPASLNPPKPLSPFTSNSAYSFRNFNSSKSKTLLKPISATPFLFPSSSNNNNNNNRGNKTPQLIIPNSPTPSNEVYQPFRPPPSPLPPQFQSLDPSAQLDILRNRLGLWFEYAPLISSLLRNGFNPPTIEESTGITGVEQNRLAVAAQVRDSLLSSNVDPQIISFFDMNGPDLLYELRFLNVPQRAAAAKHLAEHNLDGRAAQEIARAMKDFPRRLGEKGWECFGGSLPGDCVAFMHFRQSREHRSEAERVATLEKALEAAETERARERITQELEKTMEGEKEEEEISVVTVPVVRLKRGEVAEATMVGVFPVVDAGEGEAGVMEAPEIGVEGEFGVVVAEKGWRKWVVLPWWQPVGTIGKGGFVVKFGDGRVLPWKANRGYMEEEILVLADRERKEVVEENGFYLVGGGKDGLNLVVEKGGRLKEMGVNEGLGTVVLVIRPPKMEEEVQLADDDWE